MIENLILYGFIICVFLVIVLFLKSWFVVIRQTQKGLVERFGKYNRFLNAGFHLRIPFVEKVVIVNITEQLVDAQQQEIITKDNLNAKVDAQVYFKILPDEDSVKKSEYAVNDFWLQIVQLSKTTLRNIIGNLSLKEANSQRNKLNIALAEELKTQTIGWGVEVVRTELKEIQPPMDVQETMNKVVKAENEKIAALDFATARETEADGYKRSEIKKAEGLAKAIELKATAEAKAIQLVSDAAELHFKEKAQIQKKLDVLNNILQDNTKFVIPSNSDLLNVLGLDGKINKTIIPIKKKGID
jgi:regulator of protease activity HflC (stomatin/prohibitin superfamily)